MITHSCQFVSHVTAAVSKFPPEENSVYWILRKINGCLQTYYILTYKDESNSLYQFSRAFFFLHVWRLFEQYYILIQINCMCKIRGTVEFCIFHYRYMFNTFYVKTEKSRASNCLLTHTLNIFPISFLKESCTWSQKIATIAYYNPFFFVLSNVACNIICLQVLGKVPTISIDKTDGCQMYLSTESMDVELITSKSSEMNVMVPKANGDYVSVFFFFQLTCGRFFFAILATT